MHGPFAPRAIGAISGDLFDGACRRALTWSDGGPSAFATRPGGAILLACNIAFILSQIGPVKRGAAKLIGRTT